jgi:hypothetical protein
MNTALVISGDTVVVLANVIEAGVWAWKLAKIVLPLIGGCWWAYRSGVSIWKQPKTRQPLYEGFALK